MSLLSKAGELDRFLFSKVNGEWHNSFLDTFLPFTREAQLWVPFYFFLLVFSWMNFKFRGLCWALFFLVNYGISDQVSSTLIKWYFMRPRPCQDPEIMDQVRLLVAHCPGNPSFTSSHAVNHFAAAMFVFVTFKKELGKWWMLMFAWAALISYAQVYVGVHYPMDVIAGAIIGSILGYLPAIIFNKKIGLTIK